MLVPAARAGVAASQPGASAVSTIDHILTESTDAPAFRLGDAGRPFNWSTAVGDFNTDGEPDVAVADHAGTSANKYEYRIELSISGQARDNVTFESVHRAVTISVTDVDRDNDLDLVIRAPISEQPIGVWLNDGHGHFTSGDIHRIPAVLHGQQTLATDLSFAELATFDVTARQTFEASLPALRAPPSRASRRLAAAHPSDLSSPLAPSSTSPRAPPTPASDPLARRL